MKLLLNLLSLVLIISLSISCDQPPEEDHTNDSSVAAREFAKNWFAALNSSNWKEEVVPLLGEDKSFIDLHTPFREAFPDYHADIQEVIAEGNKVVVFAKIKASHQGDFPFGEFKGVEPSGKTAEWNEAMSITVEDGKMGSDPGFFVADGVGRMMQLGITCLPEQTE